jgi:hypothetical protein
MGVPFRKIAQQGLIRFHAQESYPKTNGHVAIITNHDARENGDFGNFKFELRSNVRPHRSSAAPFLCLTRTPPYVVFYTESNCNLRVIPFSATSKEFFMNIGLKFNLRTLWVCVLAILFAGSLHAQVVCVPGPWAASSTPPVIATRIERIPGVYRCGSHIVFTNCSQTTPTNVCGTAVFVRVRI